MTDVKYMIEPTEAPNLQIPKGQIVEVSIIDNSTRMYLPASDIVTPRPEHRPYLTLPSFSFLIRHTGTNRQLLFDLGLRLDYATLPPAVQDFLTKSGWKLDVDKNVSEMLQENNVLLDGIEGIILSHHHFDHLGDFTQFPRSTKIIVGQGFQKAYLPGWPEIPSSSLIEEDWKDRTVDELHFNSHSTIEIGGFKAIDYFEDGSLYLLDAPGHTIGHIAALARVTSGVMSGSEDTFVLMGGDICHYPGVLRPTEWRPLLQEYHPSPLPELYAQACPGSIFQCLHPQKSCNEPFYQMPEHCMVDKHAARDSIRKLGMLDASDNILVVLAHDESIIGIADMFPAIINNWKEKGYGERVRWRFLRDFRASLAQ
ncbi:hypothetical protein GB937_005371 [Aspergillus fischeri]|nr:hypothetical protein GB937_005371 [Aspergillus fischeri]